MLQKNNKFDLSGLEKVEKTLFFSVITRASKKKSFVANFFVIFFVLRLKTIKKYKYMLQKNFAAWPGAEKKFFFSFGPKIRIF